MQFTFKIVKKCSVNNNQFFQQEVGDIDFNPELSRRVSHAGSLGRVSPNPNTRLRSRNGSKSSTIVTPSQLLTSCQVMTSHQHLTSSIMRSYLMVTSFQRMTSSQDNHARQKELKWQCCDVLLVSCIYLYYISLVILHQ
jgi:hypothetical protein